MINKMKKETITELLNNKAFILETQAGEKLKVVESEDFETIAAEIVKYLQVISYFTSNEDNSVPAICRKFNLPRHNVDKIINSYIRGLKK